MSEKFNVTGNEFHLNGKPFKIYSGAMHYFRTLPEYWEDRLLKLKLAGFNTVETYVCWNLHEPKKNEFDFCGMLDIVRFLKTAEKLGLYAIVRPGPYICAEWDFGGFPAWLLSDKNIELRCNNETYLCHVKDYFTKLFTLLRPMLITNGGNIIAMQIENEYGSYANDKKYLNALKDMYAELGIDVLLFTSDGDWCNMLSGGTIDEILPTLNFGSRAETAFEALKPYGDLPKMCTEFWCGWFDHWGEEHHTRGADDTLKEIEDFLKIDASFNMYMFHGGTNFGFNAGANHIKRYEPTVTSYDYCAPLTEWGDYTETYHKVRELLCKKQNIPLTELPPSPETQNVGKIKFTEYADLFENLDAISEQHCSPLPRHMEAYGQNFGLIYYTTKTKGTYSPSILTVNGVHDIAHVYFDRKKIAVIDRMKKDSAYSNRKLKKQLEISVEGESEIGILVEALGRVNYGAELYDRKGISGVMIANQTLTDFTVHTIPLDNPEKLTFNEITESTQKCGPIFLKGFFKAESKDCFVNMKGFTRGYVFVNGFNLGRYWNIGPQRALYLPGALLKEENEIIVFETEKCSSFSITIQNKPDLG